MTTANLTINGKTITANIGDTLVDAAMMQRTLIPTDCCAGQCDTCRVQVVEGSVDAQGSQDGDTVLACTARVTGDAIITFDAVPEASRRDGKVVSITRLSPEIDKVVVQLNSPFTYLPGQYVKLAFAGFPSRDYSPAPRNNGELHSNELVFHIKRYEGGVVSSAIGSIIRIGHKVKVNGPFGHAFYRKGTGRLVLVASGTGWAPVWSLARAARTQQPEREILVIAGARDIHNLYMRPALHWLEHKGVHNTILTCSGINEAQGDIRAGRPTAHLPQLEATDLVYAAGAPAMVDAVKALAKAAGATCYADPFTANPASLSVMGRLTRAIAGARAGKPVANPLSPRPQTASTHEESHATQVLKSRDSTSLSDAKAESKAGLLARILRRK